MLSQDVGVPGLSREQAYSQRIPLPGPSEQRAIADFLDAETARIDALIVKKHQLITSLRERRGVITTLGVAGQLSLGVKIVSSSLSWISQRPKHWDEPLLKFVAKLGTGHTPSRSQSEWWTDCTIPWITTGEVSQMREDRIEYITETREKISELGMANSSAELHPAGTVVLSRTASAGFSAIMGTDMATSQDFVTWMCGSSLNPRYLLLCLRAMRPDLLGRLAQGSTHQTIYMPDIESIRIPLPPLEEQVRIVDAVWRTLGRIDEIASMHNRQIELLIEHRQTLITAAVTGQLEIPGAAP
jgi:type I restriction enzyme, S subunit